MRASGVVAIFGILLLLFRLFSFIVFCEAMARASVAIMWNNLLVQNKFSAHVQPAPTKYGYKNRVAGVQYPHIIPVTKFATCTVRKLSRMRKN